MFGNSFLFALLALDWGNLGGMTAVATFAVGAVAWAMRRMMHDDLNERFGKFGEKIDGQFEEFRRAQTQYVSDKEFAAALELQKERARLLEQQLTESRAAQEKQSSESREAQESFKNLLTRILLKQGGDTDKV